MKKLFAAKGRMSANGLQWKMAELMLRKQHEKYPNLLKVYSSKYGNADMEENLRQISHLFQALEFQSPKLFYEYISWKKVLLNGRNFPEYLLLNDIEILCEVLDELMPEESKVSAMRYLTSALEIYSDLPTEIFPFLRDSCQHYELAQKYLDLLLDGKRHLASKLILNAVDKGVSVEGLYKHVFQPTQYEIGRLWQINRISVAQEHYCTAATQLIMSQLYPIIFNGVKNGLVIVMTCVGKELHEVGARIVTDFFEMEGWDTYYLGAGSPNNSIIKSVGSRHPHVLGISTTMIYGLPTIMDLIEEVRSTPELMNIKVLVGGAPFNIDSSLWKKIAADGFAENAADAVKVAHELVKTTTHP